MALFMDPDSSTVVDILTGAQRGVRDPDVELARVLAELGPEPSDVDVEVALQRLIATDAGSD